MLKIKRTALLAVGLTLFQVLAWAGPRSFQQAQAIAERQAALQGIIMDQQQVSKARKQYLLNGSSSSETATSYYVFDNGSDKGFTIVSGDDELPEIVGYSAHGNSEHLMKTEGCAAFLKAYQKFVAAFTQGDAKARKILAEQRALKADGRYQQPKITPLLGDIAWNQETPYNKMCPKYEGSELSVTGCIATAMAQVMMYYKYPNELQATIPAYTTATNKLKVNAISKGEEYDWDNMLPTYTEGEYNTTQANAVAKLMFHCGAAVQMDYGDSSGALLRPEDMSTYFGYDADLLQEVYRSVYTLAEWKKILDQELEAKRPIIYGGVRSYERGHQFVCDGSDGEGLYHINWGWSGDCDGYFDITLLDPDVPGTGAGTPADGYNRDCSVIIGIAPDNESKDEPLIKEHSLYADAYENHRKCTITNGERKNASEQFSLTVTPVFSNPTHNKFEGLVALGIRNADGSYTPITQRKKVAMEARKPDGEYAINYPNFNLNYAFPVGATVLYEIYSTDNGKNWDVCAYVENVVPFELEATSTSLTLNGNKLSADLKSNEAIQFDMDNSFDITIRNDSQREYLGLINVYTSETSTKPTFNEGSRRAEEYMCVPAGESKTRTITLYQPANENEMYVWVTDRDGEILLDGVKFKVGESTGISQITAQNNVRISSAAGVLTIVSAESKLIPVYSIGGQFITKLSLSAGIPVQVNLRPGIYIVAGRKVAVK
ncbi:C10 family peptidase [Prevotella copri]|uniref:C10 family peptidase n=1 Tax=Segatella copri TaxID=165179 RepID=UPI001F3F96DE|nr:C10 family peptidase [Segatella copri]MCF2610217.1 C10 family peptidase [Segatella copri]